MCTSSMKDTAAFTMTMRTSVMRQSWGTHTIWGEAEQRVEHTHFSSTSCNTRKKRRVYLQEAVDGRNRMQQDEEEKSIQSDAGQHERPWWDETQTYICSNCVLQLFSTYKSILLYTIGVESYQWKTGFIKLKSMGITFTMTWSLTILVAGLSERFSLGEDDGHSQVLEGGDVEEGGVLVVPDVFGVDRSCHVLAERETGAGNVAGAAGQRA